MRKYFNGKKHINSLNDAIAYETDMVEINRLKEPPPPDAGDYPYTGCFKYENAMYFISLTITWSDDDIGEPYLDTVELNSCTKILQDN